MSENKKAYYYVVLDAGIEIMAMYATSFDEVEKQVDYEGYCYDEIVNVSEQIDNINVSQG